MDDDWILYSVISFTFAVIFSFCYIRHVFTFFERNKIPGPSYPSFPLGNMYDVISKKTPMFMQLWKVYNRFKRKKNNLGGFYIFVKPAILIVNPPKILLSENNDYFKDAVETNDIVAEIGDSLLCQITTKIPEIWFKLFSQFREEEVNFTHFMNHKFVNMFVEHVVGLKITQELKEVLHSLENCNSVDICQTLVSLSYPTYTNFLKKYIKTQRWRTIFENIIQNKKVQNVNGEEDFLQILIQKGVSNEDVKEFIYMMLYNLKRSNNLVLFTLYELCYDKEIQDELRGEMTRYRKTSLGTNNKNPDNLPYLEAVVCETLRKYPLEPFLHKTCTKDFLGKDIVLKKDTLVFVSTFGIHHDAQNYVNPELFDPDRFFEENTEYLGSTKYLPFGCRNEKGFDVQYVKIMMKMALLEFLSKFEFSLSKKSPKMIQFDETFKSLKFKDDLWLQIRKV